MYPNLLSVFVGLLCVFVCVCVCVCACSDSEMEIEAEHYTNGVIEGSSARIMNGTYKHEEILQPDDNSRTFYSHFIAIENHLTRGWEIFHLCV